MNKKFGFAYLPIILIIIILAAIGTGGYFYTKNQQANYQDPTKPAEKITLPVPITTDNVGVRTCTHTQGKLSCNYGWDLIIQGKTTRLVAGVPVSVPERIMVGLSDPRDIKNAQLLFTSEGTQEINELTSRKAVGSGIATGFQPAPSQGQECEDKIKGFEASWKEELNKADCYNLLVAKTLDPSICPKITVKDERDKCYTTVAIKTKDATFCQKIEKEESKQFCIALAMPVN